jgi:seryl-tRNA synthetase
MEKIFPAKKSAAHLRIISKIMLDIKWIREHKEELKRALEKRGVKLEVAVEAILKADQERREKIKEVDDLRARQNVLSDQIARTSGNEREDKLKEAKEVKTRLEAAEAVREKSEQTFAELLYKNPNIPLPEVPEGKGEADNKVVREVGNKPHFSFVPKDHLELGEALGILDFERAAKTAGSGFAYLKNEGVLLELALVRYALDFLREKGFTLWLTPDLARRRFYLGTGYQPRGPEAQTYEIAGSDLGLIATAEVSLAGIHADEILDAGRLPLRYAGYSHCFRQEAGAYGKYSRGLYRLHQFTKVEMFAYTAPDDSPRMHEEFLQIEEELWQRLGIPYRVVEMCVGDLGAQAARKFDLEAWMPGRGDWGEITSASNTTDYQARNLNIRYRTKDGGTTVAHTLNGTAVATSRAIIAILENYQQEDGSVRVPEALQTYMGGLKTVRCPAV